MPLTKEDYLPLLNFRRSLYRNTEKLDIFTYGFRDQVDAICERLSKLQAEIPKIKGRQQFRFNVRRFEYKPSLWKEFGTRYSPIYGIYVMGRDKINYTPPTDI